MRPSPLPLLLLLLSLPALAADPLQERLDLADRYTRLPMLVRDTVSRPQWLGTTDRLAYWSVLEHGGTFVVVDAAKRTQTPVLTRKALEEAVARHLGADARLPREHLNVLPTPDGTRLLFQVQGRAFALGVADGVLEPLAAGSLLAHAAAGPDAVLAPHGRAVAVRREHGFTVVGADGRTLVERSGSADDSWQGPERAWSPDGRYLAVWRNDAKGVHHIPIVDYTSALEKVELVPYTKTGTPLVRAQLHVVEAATGRVTPVPRDDAETYDFVAGWRPDGSEALVLRLSRDGKRLDLEAVAPATGKARRVLREERPESFVAALEFAGSPSGAGHELQVVPLPDNKHFLWASERDGWRHFYLYDWSGKLVRQVTRGAFPVHEVLGAAEGGKDVLVLASAEANAPYERIPYRVSLQGGKLQRLHPEAGVHRVWVSRSGRYFVDGHSSRTRPRAWDVVPSTGHGKAALRYAQADARGLEAIGYRPPEGFTAPAADGTTPMHGVLFTPRDFDPKKKYPVIDYIYAGPFITVVPQNFVGSSMSHQAAALAQLGFVVMMVDARGTPGRSKAFQDANYGRVGQTEIPDHVAALKHAASTRPYMDLTRVGIYGHSWGGYFALRGMLTAPDVFHAGYAGAPGALEEEALINEPNLGLPANNPQGYAAGDNTRVAGALKGALKLMHGTSDVNASLSTTMRVVQALVKAGKRHELLLMPGEGHSPQGPAGRFYQDDVRRFFVEKLGGPR